MSMNNTSSKKELSAIFSVMAVMIGVFFFFAHMVFGAGSPVASQVTVGSTAPAMGTVTVNGGNTIQLVPNGTTSTPITAQVNDYNGCTDFTNGTATIMLYDSAVGSSTCLAQGGTGNSNTCYIASAFTTSSCAGSLVNTTTSFNVQYFAKATDASSSQPSANWRATVIFHAPSGSTTTADSAAGATPDVATLMAFNLATSSINYGTVNASQNTGTTNQTTSLQNYGNASSGMYLYGTMFVNQASSTLTMATTSQLYATSSFNAGSAGVQLTDVQTTQISGYTLTAATTTSLSSSSVLWGLSVPGGTATGTYNATNTFSALFISS